MKDKQPLEPCLSFLLLQDAALQYSLLIKSVIFSSLLSPFCVYSESSGEDDYTKLSLQELMSLEIFTAASMLPTEMKKAPGTVYSFDREDFLRLGVRTIDDLLEYVPGLQLNQYKKRHRSVWSRGVINRYNNKMKLLVDGVPIQHVYYGDFSGADKLPMDKVDKVEVIVGPASSLYGANAFAGVISVTTRAFTADAQTSYMETTLDVGDNSRAGANIFYNSQKLQGFVSYLDQDAPFRKNRTSFIGDKVSQPLNEKYKNLSFKVQPLKGLQWSFNYQSSDTPFLFAPGQLNIDTDAKNYNTSLHYETGNLEQGKWDILGYYTDDQAKEAEYEQNSGQLAYKEQRDALYYGIKATWFKKLFSNHTLSIGTEWQHDEAKDMDRIRYWDHKTGFLNPAESGSLLTNPDVKNNDYALFVQDVWSLTHELTMTLGGRYDEFDAFDNDANFRFAMVYTPTEQQTWKILWGSSVRKPSYREYLKVLENTPFVQPGLDTEQMETFELGYAYQWENANISVTTFYNEFEDFIKEAPTPVGDEEYFVNAPYTWRMHGVEVLSEYRPFSRVYLRASLGWLRAKNRQYNDIPYIAEWSASLFADYQWYHSHFVGISSFYNSSKEDTNDARYRNDEPDSFVSVNFNAHGELFEHISYQMGVKNISNEKIYDPAGDFSEGYNTQRSKREVWGKLTYRYQF